MKLLGSGQRPRGGGGLLGPRRPGRVPGRPRKKKMTWVVLGIAAVLIAGILLSAIMPGKTGVEGVLGTLVSPLVKAADWVSSGFGGVFTSGDGKELQLLKDQLAQAQTEALRLSEMEKENDRLRELLGSMERMPDFEYVPARVIGADQGLWFKSLVVDRGAKDGIVKNMPVVAADGLVGLVTELGHNWALVRTLVDTQSGVSGIVERTRDYGIVKGNLLLGDETDMARMQYLPIDVELNPGDRVLTSGLDGVYPKGLVIGEIVEVARQQDSQQRYAVVNPAVDFNHLEDVAILLNAVTPLEALPSAAPTPTPSAQPRPSYIQGPPTPTPAPTPEPTPTPPAE